MLNMKEALRVREYLLCSWEDWERHNDIDPATADLKLTLPYLCSEGRLHCLEPQS